MTIEVPREVEFIESENTVVEARGRSVVEGRGNGDFLMGTEFQFKKMKNLGDG